MFSHSGRRAIGQSQEGENEGEREYVRTEIPPLAVIVKVEFSTRLWKNASKI